MRTIFIFSLLTVAAFALSACAPAANTNTNAGANTNANMAAKPAAPTADALMALDQKAWEAYKNKDGKYFEGFLGDTMISGEGRGTMPKAEVVKMIAENKDDIKSFTLSDPHVTPAGADVAVLTYKATTDGTENGKPIPSPSTVATVFVRNGSDWKAVYHEEVAIVDMTKAAGDKKDAAAGEEKKDATADKKEAAPANTEKKDMAAAPHAANSNMASNSSNSSNSSNTNSNSSASTGDAALTDALMVMEKKGWDSWKAKDSKGLDETLAKDFGFVDTMGKATLSRADALKGWTTDNPCNVSSVSLSDGKGYSLTKDAAILVVKGTAVGTCGDAKLEPLWNTTVFVKEGDMWKAAYIFEKPVGKM